MQPENNLSTPSLILCTCLCQLKGNLYHPQHYATCLRMYLYKAKWVDTWEQTQSTPLYQPSTNHSLQQWCLAVILLQAFLYGDVTPQQDYEEKKYVFFHLDGHLIFYKWTKVKAYSGYCLNQSEMLHTRFCIST